jgi:uncharacterized repeat protein (TIGR01451 family)
MNLQRVLFASAAFLLAAAAHALSVSIYGQFYSPCGQPRGQLGASPSGGVPPYSYSWSNGATTSSIGNLPPGTYTVTVTDNVGTQASATQDITVISAYPALNPVVSLSNCPSGAPYAIFPINDPTILSPTEPTTFTGFNVADQFVSDNGSWWVIQLGPGLIIPGTNTIQYQDAFGCPGEFNWIINDPVYFPTISVSNLGGSCTDGATGTATLTVPEVVGENDLHLTLKDSNGNIFYSTECLGEGIGGWSGAYIPFTSLPPGDYTAVLDVDEYCLFGALPDFLSTCADSVQFTIGDLGVTCGTVAGTSWYDVDGDCVLDPEDAGVPYSVLLVQPGALPVLTGADGTYQFELNDGTYTLEQSDASLIPICPASQPVPFVVNNDETTIDLANGSTEPLDIAVHASGSAARPGFQHFLHARVRNLSPQLSGPVTVTMTLDDDLDYISASPAPTSVIGNLLTWSLPPLGLFAETSFSVTMSVPVGTPLGTEVAHTVAASNTLAEGAYSNNTTNWTVQVTGSFDPNDKVARTSSGQSGAVYYIDQDDYIDYTIRFQNTGTDTAFTVIITDTLPEALDMTSFEQGAASHSFEVRFKAGRVVEWRFDGILLPDSATNEPESHGLVGFRIRPNMPIAPSTVIENIANIFFDFNDPVITEPSVLVAEFSTGVDVALDAQVAISPNPTSDQVRVGMPDGSIHRVRLFSMDGRLIMDEVGHGESVALDVSELPPGTYLLELTTSRGSGPASIRQLVRSRISKI